MPFGGLLTAGLIGGGASLIGSIFGASAAEKASQQQVAEEQQALQFQQTEYNQQQANQAPFLAAGQSSVTSLMNDFSNGTYGPGSIQPFTAPTLAQAQQMPGYQFTQAQGDEGILAAAAASGGAITGGTEKALDIYNTGLADSSYQQLYNQAMSAYQAQLQTQAQGFGQLLGTAQLGEGTAANLGQTGAQAANTVGSTLSSIGNSQAAGTIGTANAITGGLTGAASSATLPFYLQALQWNNPNSPQYNDPNWAGQVTYSQPTPNGLPSYTSPTGSVTYANQPGAVDPYAGTA